MSDPSFSLPALGWTHFFQQQMSLEEYESCLPARVCAVHRSGVEVLCENSRRKLTLPGHWQLQDPEERPTIGDWLLLDRETGLPQRQLERKSLFRRMAAGREARVQLLAANVDTLFIVTSCNRDFNPSRLERYLALALDAGVEPVLMLTKADQAENIADFMEQAMRLNRDVAVEAVNALDPESVAPLRPWCRAGQTVALVGSSGVGKSTLVNTLCRGSLQETGSIRESDARGRHTTTSRTLHALVEGGVLLDSPGLRELQLSDCREGVATLFGDIEELARSCHFSDCRHQGEKGCAVQAAVAWGDLDPRRLANYQKLLLEQERTAETLAERRSRDRKFGKMVRSVLAAKRRQQD